ncbi:hypothetical protein DCC85_20890 [Paenibacillus sp. CAA11]|uniref:hypothetical protein n=1 Tax=Paenibacillus sp. CAA11 TaxID=1532905 RepID=UPI000D363DB7|nr:hypothetical protein [Paenibacillus sp. CAA11]AWB46377.1 hypothetical protein DCC85_20890 [Paenibacillus sp. CAA11]
MTKDKTQKRERQLASSNNQGSEVGGRGELRSGRKSQFKNHRLGVDGLSNVPNEYLSSEEE